MAACRGCGANIEWVVTAAGKKTPVDPKRLIIVTDDGRVVHGRQSHFATCVKADEFRKGE